jgi:two-component system sensor histidine kinase RpfC
MVLAIPSIAATRTLWVRLQARSDSEHEQALIRIVIAAIVWVYLRWSYDAAAPNAHHQYLILWFLGIDLVLCALLMAHIALSPAVNRTRRVIGMINDAGMSTLVMFLTGEAGASMIGLFLFITFGNGFRYGRAYLFACQALCIAGFAGVLLLHPHWQMHQTMGWSLMVALVVLPLYVSTLLKRIEQARARAEEANRAKSTFLANMSHEMRTPLNGIVGAVELFRTTPLDARQIELTRLLQHSVGMLRVLVDDVLDIEKIEAGRLTIEIADFDLHGMLNGLVNLMRPHARHKGLTLTAMVDPAIDYRLRGDVHHLTQILLNLVSNAVKFTQSGFVEIAISNKSETDDGYILRFEVRDSGIGIPPEAQGRIFERFVQADDSTTRRFGGTGLGTTIAKQLVELMGGQIGLKSDVGVGSTFWFELPLMHAQELEPHDADLAHERVGVIVANVAERERVRALVAGVCSDTTVIDPRDDAQAEIERVRHSGKSVNAVFYSGEMAAAQLLFAALSADPRNAGTALIFVTPVAGTLADATALREIDGVNLVDRNASPRHIENAIHAATSKAGVGNVIDLRAVLEEQRQRLRILVAEDNVTNQQIIRELLERAGHEVILASDGESALDLYEEQEPDLAVLDFNMPHRNGLEVTKAIRAMEPSGTRLPIMILSASVTSEARDRARRSGADEFVGKPYEAAMLLHTIDRMTHRRHAASSIDQESPTGKAEVRAFAAKAQPVLDLERLGEVQRIAGNADFMTRLVNGFDGDVMRLLSELDDVLVRNELSRVADITHAMKGAALGIGASRLASQCVELENAARAGNESTTRAIAAALRVSIEQTKEQLQQHAFVPMRAVSH